MVKATLLGIYGGNMKDEKMTESEEFYKKFKDIESKYIEEKGKDCTIFAKELEDFLKTKHETSTDVAILIFVNLLARSSLIMFDGDKESAKDMLKNIIDIEFEDL